MLARMADAGFSPAELVALLASHSVANVVRLLLFYLGENY